MREPLHWDRRAVDRIPELIICAMIGCMGLIWCFTAYASSNCVGHAKALGEGFMHSKRLHDELQCSSARFRRIMS